MLIAQTGRTGGDQHYNIDEARAEELEQKTLFYDAIEIWQRVLNKSPNNSRAYFGIARGYMRLGHYKQALDFVEKALLLANQNYQIGILKSRVQMGLEQYEKAKATLLELKEKHSNYQIDLALSELFAVLGDLATSVKYLNAIKEFASEDLNFQLTSLMIYEEAGKIDTANTYLQKALDAYYNEPVVHKLAAAYYLRRGLYDKIQQEIDILKSLGIDTEELNLLNLEAAYLNGDYELASNLAKALLETYPKNAKAWYMLGLSYSNAGNMEKALDALNTARRITPNDELIKIVIADILRKKYNYPSQWHKKEAMYYIANAVKKHDDLLYEEALQNYRFALQIDPLNSENWMAFASVFRDRGNYAKYLDKLYSWKEFYVKKGDSSPELEGLIRLYEASTPQSVAYKWGIEQFFYHNNFYPIQFFVIQGSSRHVEIAGELGSHFINILQWYEQPFVIDEVKNVFDDLEAQKLAYNNRNNSDYYIILNFTKSINGSFRFEFDLYLSATGKHIKQYVIERVSNGNIYRSFVSLAKQLNQLFPQKARIIKAKVNRAVMSLGSLDGIKKGQEWLILSNTDGYFGEYKNSDVIGILTVDAVDEKVSEGTVKLRSLVNRVQTDYIVLPSQPKEEVAEQVAPKNTIVLQEPNIDLKMRLFELDNR